MHEAPYALPALARLAAENFDGDLALEVMIIGAVNLAHPTRAEERAHFVAAEACAGLKRHRTNISLCSL